MRSSGRESITAALTDGATHLILAGKHGHAAVVRLLLDRGADIDARDGEGHTALLVAGQGGHRDVVRLLVEAARR
jgi:uncharacterized protein